MPKPRSKRTAIREERKKRKAEEAQEGARRNKRVRQAEDDNDDNDAFQHEQDESSFQHQPEHQNHAGEREFFGMLADDEQEYFRHADEMLEINQFPSPEDRQLFIESVYREAQGKELKLASSQSCSRLMERLIQISTTAQKKQLFEAFGTHFLSLVQHRFASHCCETLFLRSAGVVTQELAGFVMDTTGASDDQADKGETSMEGLFLATLDELEGHLSYLITDRFASHTLRVLLLVLSGRPLDDASTKTLMKSKKKENISVAGSAEADQENQGLRAVPSSFAMAVRKIIQDSVSEMDATSLRVLAKHPIGNPTLQLLLELDLTLSKQDSKSEADGSDSARPTLLYQLLPGAPKSLSEETSEASEFINGMIYDQIGSRLVETLITHAPGKIFKALNQNIFLPRIQGYVRNDVSSYASIRVLNRLGKDDLVKAVDQIAPTVPQLVGKARYNVLRTLFERCSARGINDEVKRLNKGLKEGCGPEPADLITTLCCLKDEVEEKKKKKDVNQLARNEYAIQSHGAQLLTTLLSIPGPLKGVQEALLSLSPELLLRLAKTSMPTVTVLTTAFATSSANPAFHKIIVAKITPHISELATSQYGHNLVNALVEVPSKGKERSIPFHMKEAIMSQLGQHESELRDCWMGRSVWRSWKGDMWKTRRGDWKIWMREVDALVEQKPSVGKNGVSSANSVAVEARRGRASQNDEEKVAQQEPEQIPEVVMEDVVVEAAEEAAEKPKKKKKKDKDGKEKKSKKAKKDEDEE